MPKKQKDKPVVWSFEARQNLEEIFNYISEHFSHALAVEKTGVVLDEVETLSKFPRKGKISTHFNELRELIVDANTVYYRNNEADIVIASVRARRTEPKKK